MAERTTEEDWIDASASVREGEELDADALRGFLSDHLRASGAFQVRQFPSGFSNLTYEVRMGETELVLRRPPFGANAKGGHDMAREYRVLSGLHEVWPKAPRPLAYCEDEAVIGAPFYLMQRVRGLILRDRLPDGMVMPPPRMREVCESVADTLVELHGVDYAAAGLGDLGRPQGYVRRQVEGWSRRYERAETEGIPSMNRTAAWLADNVPRSGAPALIHNDYKYDNVVLDPQDLTEVRAVLDWEMATVGDPLMDVGTTLAYWSEPGDPAPLQSFSISHLAGNMTRRELADYYAERSGRDTSGILFHYVFGLFKVAVIVQQIYWRFDQGFTSDERFASLIGLVRLCGDAGQRAIERERISNLYD